MSNISDKRIYAITDAKLCSIASRLYNFVQRDFIDFESFGIDNNMLLEFSALKNNFELFITDGSFIGDIMITTEDKNALREQVLQTIRQMAIRVSAKWGLKSLEYKRLGLKNINQLSDELLLITAMNVRMKMDDYLPNLIEFGLSQAKINEFQDLISNFEIAKKIMLDTISMREVNRKTRVNLGNELYNLIVRYTSIGKLLYKRSNPAKYNDYLIYKF